MFMYMLLDFFIIDVELRFGFVFGSDLELFGDLHWVFVALIEMGVLLVGD